MRDGGSSIKEGEPWRVIWIISYNFLGNGSFCRSAGVPWRYVEHEGFVHAAVGLSEGFGVFGPAEIFFAACLQSVGGWAIVAEYTNSSPTAWHVAPPKSSSEER